MTGIAEGAGRSGRAAELDRAERMYRDVLGEPRGRRPGGAVGLTRRVMVSVAGVTLLSGCGVAVAAKTGRANGASGPLGAAPRDAPSPSGSPQASGSAGSSAPGGPPTDVSSSPVDTGTPTDPFTGTATDSPTLSGPNVVNSGPGTAGSVVQTKPQYYVDAGPKVIALTLDDGPGPYTTQILEILAQYKVIATFCMIGRQVGGYASIVKEVAAAGHHVTNHTWDHKDQSKLSKASVTSELVRTSEALANVGITPSMYRAPYGSWSPTVFEVAAEAGLRVLDWSVDPRDWSMPGVSSIVNNIMRHTSTGSIILDHDGGGNRSQTVAAMRIWLPRLLADGYRFTTP